MRWALYLFKIKIMSLIGKICFVYVSFQKRLILFEDKLMLTGTFNYRRRNVVEYFDFTQNAWIQDENMNWDRFSRCTAVVREDPQ